MQQRILQIAVVVFSIAVPVVSVEAEKPNVVIVITDDQGHGDVAFDSWNSGSRRKKHVTRSHKRDSDETTTDCSAWP